jgi:hypothetical protein
LVINPNAATVILGNLNQTYTGSAISVTASTIPPGLTVNLTYNGSPNAPTNAGSYTVIGTVSDPYYAGGATNTLVINLATATVTLSNLNQFFTGSAISVSVNTTPPGLSVNLTYNGSPFAPTNAGSYTVNGGVERHGFEPAVSHQCGKDADAHKHYAAGWARGRDEWCSYVGWRGWGRRRNSESGRHAERNQLLFSVQHGTRWAGKYPD